MKKILFNDDHMLTRLVLAGRKTMTRRVAKGEDPQYKVGEVVAIAQNYHTLVLSGYNLPGVIKNERTGKETVTELHPGWKNKMFVKAELMPHHIRIVKFHGQLLQDISEEDCLREGIDRKTVHLFNPEDFSYGYWHYDPQYKRFVSEWFTEAKGAFAGLIDSLSGKGVWESNPLVYVYEFELVD